MIRGVLSTIGSPLRLFADDDEAIGVWLSCFPIAGSHQLVGSSVRERRLSVGIYPDR
jgi:hypothetical protein